MPQGLFNEYIIMEAFMKGHFRQHSGDFFMNGIVEFFKDSSRLRAIFKNLSLDVYTQKKSYSVYNQRNEEVMQRFPASYAVAVETRIRYHIPQSSYYFI